MTCCQVQLRRHKNRDAAASGESSELTSPSLTSCDLHELTSSPMSSDLQDNEDEQLDAQPEGIDYDIFLKPSSYVLPNVVSVNGMPPSVAEDELDD